MGINISIYKINTIRDDDGYLTEETRVNDAVGWDGLRYAGDKEFAFSSVCDFAVTDRFPNPETSYFRPSDIDKARLWVNENLPEGNRKRYLDIFDLMEKDKTLYFYFGW